MQLKSITDNLNGTWKIILADNTFTVIRRPERKMSEIARLVETCTNIYEIRDLNVSQ